MSNTVGVYIHIPFCKSKCDYCDFYSLAGQEELMDRYQKALLAQLKSFAPRLKGWVADTSISEAEPPLTMERSGCGSFWAPCSACLR